MTLRLISSQMFKHGRILLLYKRDIYTTIIQRLNFGILQDCLRKAEALAQGKIRNQDIFGFRKYSRRLIVNNILNNSLLNSYSADLISQTTKNLYSTWSPSFALIGVSLGSRNLMTKDDQIESVCYEIRGAVSRFQQCFVKMYWNGSVSEEFGLKNLDVGSPIAKGCSAVVYAARFKDKNNLYAGYNADSCKINIQCNSFTGENLSHESNQTRHKLQETVESSHCLSYCDSTENIAESEMESNILEFPLALKIMFNYDIESNSTAILRAMHKETVPAERRYIETTEWQKKSINETIFLPSHPNIVDIYGVFCDRMPKLHQASTLYPLALPPSINSQGCGRNMSMFLLMKRYDLSLREFLDETKIGTRDRVLLFTQLLEAATHLNRHGIAHRDIKSDNILVELNGKSVPVLVLSDFGCCIADKGYGLKIPYYSGEIDKGGNTALMAPEIISKEPGVFSILDYSKSDLWACGTIAYEIFGQINPFYRALVAEKKCALQNVSYTVEELPKMNEEIPLIVRKLVENILHKNPRKRVSTDVAANIMQLYLWAPSHWFNKWNNPSNNQILQWLLCLTTKTLCAGRRSSLRTNELIDPKIGQNTYTDYLLISNFLSRVRLNHIRYALKWIQIESKIIKN